MIIINLLPEEMRPTTHSPIPYLASGLFVTVGLLVMLGLWVAAQGAAAAERRTLEGLRVELQDARYVTKEGFDDPVDVIEEHNSLEEQKVALAERIDIINEIVADRIIWSEQLWRLSTVTPPNVWFSGIEVVERSFRETRMVYDPRRKKEMEKKVQVRRNVLEISGYVIPDEDGNARINPLTFAIESAEFNVPFGDEGEVRVEQFSDMFELRGTELEDTEFFEYPVRSFKLEYLIKTGEPAP